MRKSSYCRNDRAVPHDLPPQSIQYQSFLFADNTTFLTKCENAKETTETESVKIVKSHIRKH